MQLAQTGYPTNVQVDPAVSGRNRLTTAFRLILAIPHLFLAGVLSGGYAGGGNSRNGSGDVADAIFAIVTIGILGIAAVVMAILSWFAILFTGRHPKSFWEFEYWVLRWQARVSAYVCLLRDEYPPFGEGEYPAQMETTNPDGPRNRVTVFFRLFMLIPHIVILAVLNIAWGVTTVIAWFVILFTGADPQGLYEFGVNVFRWQARVAAYGFLLRDEYPPFALSA